MGDGRPSHYHKVCRVMFLGEMYAVPEVRIDKIQAYPTLKNVKEVQTFLEILGIGGFLFPSCYSYFIPYATS